MKKGVTGTMSHTYKHTHAHAHTKKESDWCLGLGGHGLISCSSEGCFRDLGEQRQKSLGGKGNNEGNPYHRRELCCVFGSSSPGTS